MEKAKTWPSWLYSLLSTSFFHPCKSHLDSSKNECNMYCLDCTNGAICSSCLVYHRDHRTIQIRRSSYHDVVRVSEIHKFLDLSGVQTYIINGARVVFLNERPQPRLGKGVTNTCEHCRRSLLDAFTFCSLGCKLAMSTSNSAKFYENTQSRSEDDSSKQSKCSYPDGLTLGCISTQRPAPAIMTYRMTKRRKGIPHRAPMGVC
ncbi:protein RGF1 INDUCIBLE TRANSCRIPTION FACTOR 1-like isoform X1 [Typha latifolia]|uniref:protein RGF1 INDUCIBLE TRANSCRIPTION FACTOR 1-like isoform X1 n=1 Tax=Typha latifolia TaxID=4733 RepID=UPI003C2D0E51